MTVIRPLAEADLHAVATMIGDLNEHEGSDRGTAPDAAALCRAFLTDPTGYLLVAETLRGLDGYVTLHVTYETEFAARGCYLGDLYVRPEARRAGIGRALLAAAARLARAEGGTFLWWTARPENSAGHAFYRALGAEGEPLRAFALTFDAFDRLATEAAP